MELKVPLFTDTVCEILLDHAISCNTTCPATTSNMSRLDAHKVAETFLATWYPVCVAPLMCAFEHAHAIACKQACLNAYRVVGHLHELVQHRYCSFEDVMYYHTCGVLASTLVYTFVIKAQTHAPNYTFLKEYTEACLC